MTDECGSAAYAGAFSADAFFGDSWSLSLSRLGSVSRRVKLIDVSRYLYVSCMRGRPKSSSLREVGCSRWGLSARGSALVRGT